MKAYLDNPKLKERLLKEIKKHEKADAIVQGTYGNKDQEEFKGCAVGCSLKSLNIINGTNRSTETHKRFETELGIPESLAWLEDGIFEGLPIEEAKKWPYQFAKAIPVGADLSMVEVKFKIWLLDKKNDVYKNAFDDGKKAIDMVVKVLKDFLKTGKLNESSRSAAESAAWSAAWSAARSAAESAAWSAAWSAARSAARSAAESAARSAAWSAAYKKQAKKLLQLLKEA